MILYNHEIHDIAYKWIAKLIEDESEKNISIDLIKSLL